VKTITSHNKLTLKFSKNEWNILGKTSACKKCKKYSKPKGHLDTQLFPECEGTKYDRNIVKKTVERRKKEK